jgi:hypothetical protein
MWRFLVVLCAVGCEVGVPPDGEDPVDTGALTPIDEALHEIGSAPSDVRGCIDVMVYGGNTEHAVIVAYVDDGLAEAAEATGAVQAASYVLPDPRVDVRVLLGVGVMNRFCTDYGTGGVVDFEAVAVEGHVDVEVVPDAVVGSGINGTPIIGTSGTVALENLILEDLATGDSHELSFVVLEDAFVGWIPGR